MVPVAAILSSHRQSRIVADFAPGDSFRNTTPATVTLPLKIESVLCSVKFLYQNLIEYLVEKIIQHWEKLCLIRAKAREKKTLIPR